MEERERDIVCMSACVSACLCLRLCVCGWVCARKYVRVMVVRGSRGTSGYRISWGVTGKFIYIPEAAIAEGLNRATTRKKTFSGQVQSRSFSKKIWSFQDWLSTGRFANGWRNGEVRFGLETQKFNGLYPILDVSEWNVVRLDTLLSSRTDR